jgi:uncharacterized protein
MYEIATEEKKEIEVRIGQFVSNRTEIALAYLHGSFPTRAFRDIDLAVVVNDTGRRKSLQYELDMESELEQFIGFPFDVRILNQAPLSFRFSVIRSGVLLFSRNEGFRSDFEALTIVEYHDFDFVRRTYRREAIGIKKRPIQNCCRQILPDSLHRSSDRHVVGTT